jgi:transcriptional regulator with XRE-family HTH domain
MTLRDVMVRSSGRFKASVLGGYERGERAISVKRFVALAQFYGIPADRLLAEALTLINPAGREEVVIDLSALRLVGGEEGRVVAEFVHRIRSERRDYLGEVVTLRAGDLEVLSLASGRSPEDLRRRLEPALRPPRRPREGAPETGAEDPSAAIRRSGRSSGPARPG